MPKTSQGPKRTQAERRTATKAAIMEACIAILVDEGYAGFSASRVASVAGVSRGAQEHYYPRKIDLIQAVTNHVMADALTHTKLLSEQIDPAQNPIEKFIEDSNWFFSSRSFTAVTEILIASRADRDLAELIHPIVVKTRKELDQVWVDVLSAAGLPRQKTVEFMDMTQYILRGLFFGEKWVPFPPDREAVLKSWYEFARYFFAVNKPAAAD